MTAFFLLLRGVPVLVWPLIFVSGLWLFSKHQVKTLRNQIVVEQAERDRAVTEANQRANKAAFSFEEWKSRQQPKTVYITRKVRDAIAAAPAWASQPLPSSVLDAASAAAAGIDPAQPDGAVRAPGAQPENERGAAGSLRPGAGFMGRMFGQTPSTRESD